MYSAKPLTVSNVSFQYPSPELSFGKQPLIHDLSFKLNPGNMLHIQGPNGSGKTTLLKLLAGLYRPDEGEIYFGESEIWSDIRAYHLHVQYLGHKNGFHPDLTILEHCRLDWSHGSLESLDPILNELGLLNVKNRPCYLLSAGQKRRVALLRLFFSAAVVWLLDEPLVALDQQGIDFLMHRMQGHIAQGGFIIYTSHQPLPWHAAGYQEILLCNR